MNSIPDFQPVIRRVTLRTPDASRLANFYQMVLGLRPRQDSPNRLMVSLHDPLTDTELLTLIEDRGARKAPPHAPGLFHIAFLFPHREDWLMAVNRALHQADGQWGAADHGVSWAVYFSDPDGNGIELAWDKPASEWPWHGDQIRMTTRTLPLRGLLLAAGEPSASPGTFSIGHLHLRVPDLQLAKIYQEHLGLRVTQADYPGALFLARGGYHHHLALNVWHAAAQSTRPPDASGLVGWEMSRAHPADSGMWRDPIGHDVKLT